MGTLVISIILCIIVPLLMFSGLLDKKNKILIFSLMLGCIVCLFAYYLNSFLQDNFFTDQFYYTTTISPIIEESLKFIPIIIFSLILKKNSKRLIPSAFAVGIGFAIIENAYMLTQNLENVSIIWILIRGICAGLMHGVCTTMIGIGIFKIQNNRRLYFVGTLSSLFLAIMYHGLYNCFVQLEQFKVFGVLLPIVTYLVIFFVYNKDSIKEFITGNNN